MAHDLYFLMRKCKIAPAASFSLHPGGISDLSFFTSFHFLNFCLGESFWSHSVICHSWPVHLQCEKQMDATEFIWGISELRLGA